MQLLPWILFVGLAIIGTMMLDSYAFAPFFVALAIAGAVLAKKTEDDFSSGRR